MKRIWAASMMALALAAVAGKPAMAQITRVRVTGGTIEGSVAGGLSEFKGIPFAAPPVGALRWKSPQPLQRRAP